jgi:hypothetical protein
MIGLIDCLKAAGTAVNLNSLKVHLACWNGREHPIDVYYAGDFKEWQEGQTKRNFKCQHLLGLIDMGQANWLFAGAYEVLGPPMPNAGGGWKYSTRLLRGQEDMIGRIIVHHKRTRQSYIWYEPTITFTIVDIRREKLTIEEFLGYNAVILSHSKLKIIVEQRIASWHAALANVKGIYLITDTATGRHYVGKASGEVGIWQRWCSYAKDGHGGNVELRKLLDNLGHDQMCNFQYSILEIADTHASDADILRRESYWMNALRSRGLGLN